MKKINIGLVDDHQLFLKSLALLLESYKNFDIVIEAGNGEDLLHKLKSKKIIPDIILLDVNMPIMNGIETAKKLSELYPEIKLVALSMNDDDNAIIQMFKSGCTSYLLKDTHPIELEKALYELSKSGYYNSDPTIVNFKRLLNKPQEDEKLKLSDRELDFLTKACSDETYRQIASEMNVSERTVDGYREALFKKFNVQSRVGLCLEAIRQKYVKL